MGATCCEHGHEEDASTPHDGSSTIVKEICSLCDFDFFKADVPTYWVLTTPQAIVPTYYHFSIAQRTSWAVRDLRTHSPPLV